MDPAPHIMVWHLHARWLVVDIHMFMCRGGDSCIIELSWVWKYLPILDVVAVCILVKDFHRGVGVGCRLSNLLGVHCHLHATCTL